MILIESVRVREIKEDRISIPKCRPSVRSFDPSAPMEEIMETETVRGRRFRCADGTEVCLGMTKEVRDVLKLPLDVYEDMSGEIYNLQKELKMVRGINRRLTHRLKVIRGMGFWERLNRLFVGFNNLNLK